MTGDCHVPFYGSTGSEISPGYPARKLWKSALTRKYVLPVALSPDCQDGVGDRIFPFVFLVRQKAPSLKRIELPIILRACNLSAIQGERGAIWRRRMSRSSAKEVAICT